MKKSKVCLAAIAAMAMGSSTIVPTFAATNDVQQAEGTEGWSYTTNYTKMLISPGADETMLNFSWYSTQEDKDTGKSMVQITETSNIKNGNWPSDGNLYDSYQATVEQSLVEGNNTYYSNRATAKGLKENTSYSYRYSSDGKTWSPIYKYNTKDFDDYSVMYVGDPQIGAKNAQTDTEGWEKTLNTAVSMFPNVSNIISVGDQTNEADNSKGDANKKFEIQMAGYLNPTVLRSLPVATLVGNHETGGPNFNWHTNNPNQSDLGATKAGADYWYTYGNTLYLVLNTNNSNAAEHETFINQAINANPDAKWTVAMFHQDIYGSGAPHSDSDGAEVRKWIDPVLNKFDIDVVLTGHDHSYARSYQLKDGQVVETKTDESGRAVNPEGIVYMAANSATGSKYYDLAPQQQYYVAYREQANQRSFSVLDVDDVSFSIRTYNAETGNQIDDTYTIVKSATYEDLMGLVEKANEQLKDTAQYTPASVDALKKAVAAASEIEKTSDLSEETIANAYADLKDASSGLVTKADKNVLNNTLDTVKAVLDKAVVGDKAGQYTKAAKDALQKAYDEAKKVAEDENTAQPAADKANSTLKAALETFKASVIKGEAVNPADPQEPVEKPIDNNKGSDKDITNAGTDKTNKNDSPNTGIIGNAGLYAAGSILPLAVIGGYVVYMKNKKETEEE